MVHMRRLRQQGRALWLGRTLTASLWPPDNSAPMTQFIQSAPAKSLLLMVTQDDGSTR